MKTLSFLRLRNVRVGYTFPKQMLGDFWFVSSYYLHECNQSIHMDKMDRALDPDDSNNLASYEYPSSRIVTIGVNLTFKMKKMEKLDILL